MIVDRAKNLCVVIELGQKRQADVDRLQALQSAAAKLSERVAELNGLVAWRAALIARGAGLTFLGNSVLGSLEAIKVYEGLCRENLSAAADPVAINQAHTALRNVNAELRAALSLAWLLYVEGGTPTLNAQVLGVLGGTPSLQDKVRRLNEYRDSIERLKTELPKDVSAIAAFDDTVKKIKSIWHNLGGDELGPEVSAFLQEAGVSGASLDRLTPSIQEWLKSHGIWDAFRITPARTFSVPIAGR